MSKRRHKSKRRSQPKPSNPPLNKGIVAVDMTERSALSVPALRKSGSAAEQHSPTIQPAVDAFEREYAVASSLAEQGSWSEASAAYIRLKAQCLPSSHQALVENDLGSLAFLAGDADFAKRGFTNALTINPDCRAARENLELLDLNGQTAKAARAMVAASGVESDTSPLNGTDLGDEWVRKRPPLPSLTEGGSTFESGNARFQQAGAAVATGPGAVRVAIVSLLFNWPSTGGGTVHTQAETGKFTAMPRTPGWRSAALLCSIRRLGRGKCHGKLWRADGAADV